MPTLHFVVVEATGRLSEFLGLGICSLVLAESWVKSAKANEIIFLMTLACVMATIRRRLPPQSQISPTTPRLTFSAAIQIRLRDCSCSTDAATRTRAG